MKKRWRLVLMLTAVLCFMAGTTGCEDEKEEEDVAVVKDDDDSVALDTSLAAPAEKVLQLSPKPHTTVAAGTIVKLDWRDVDNAVEYEVRVAGPVESIFMVSKSEADWAATKPGDYLWAVRAKNAAGFGPHGDIWRFVAVKVTLVDIRNP